MAMHIDGGVNAQAREAKLFPVLTAILGLTVCIVVFSYVLGTYVL
jgi:hypothetical protein